MNRAIAAISIATICLCGCARHGAAGVDALAERYVHLALAVAARDADSLDFYAGPSAWQRDAGRAYRPLADVKRDLFTLDRDLSREAGGDRRRQFLIGQTAALVARIEMLEGRRWRFDDEAERLFGIAPTLLDPRAVAAARLELAQVLPAGRSDLAARLASYEQRRLVPAVEVTRGFESALAACRARTRAQLPLPSDESVSVEVAPTTSPWSAFTRYTGRHHSVIQINTTFAFTDGDLRDLACHEGYPGHHTAYVLQDDALVRKDSRIEFTIEPLFSPQSLLSEAAASYAPALAFPERARSVEAILEGFDTLRLDIARRYIDGDLEFARAAAALERQTFVADASPALKFLNEFRTYVATYTAGRLAVARIVERSAAGDARWRAYRDLLLAGTLPAAAPRP